MTASKAIALLNRHSGISKAVAIRSTVDHSPALVKANAPISGLSGHKREPDSGFAYPCPDHSTSTDARAVYAGRKPRALARPSYE